jgi:hypothetical protein
VTSAGRDSRPGARASATRERVLDGVDDVDTRIRTEGRSAPEGKLMINGRGCDRGVCMCVGFGMAYLSSMFKQSAKCTEMIT